MIFTTFRSLINLLESTDYKDHSISDLELLLKHHTEDLAELKKENGDTTHTIRDIKRIKQALAKLKDQN